MLGQRLIQRFGSPAAIFQASFADLVALKGISPAMAQAIRGFKDWDKLEEGLARLKSAGVEMLTRDDPRFPARLKEILERLLKSNRSISSHHVAASLGYSNDGCVRQRYPELCRAIGEKIALAKQPNPTTCAGPLRTHFTNSPAPTLTELG